MSFGFLFLPFTNSYTCYLAVFFLGIGGSFTHTIRSVVYASYFGRRNAPKIQPLATSLTVAGSAVGPFPFGIVHDNLGSFKLAFVGSSAVLLLASLLVWLFGKKKKSRLLNGGGDSIEFGYKKVSNEEEKTKT